MLIEGKQSFKEFIEAVDEPCSRLLRRISDSRLFELKPDTQQAQIFLRGAKVGGFNKRNKQWYVSKVFVDQMPSNAIPFLGVMERKEHPPGHIHWICTGPGSSALFEALLARLVNDEI